jgi:alanine-synthesizing transaminase
MRSAFSSRLPWPAHANALASLRAELRAKGKSILELSESNPTRVGLYDETDLDSLLGSFLKPANLRYEPDPRGILGAREALAADYASRRDLGTVPGFESPGPDRLFLCASTSEAYGWLFKLLCDPGDAVLVPRPGYPLFDYLAGFESVEARSYRLDYAHPSGWRIDLDSVKSALDAGRAKALVLINPNNPTGSYVREAERKALVELCARSGCALIADEVFYGFPVEGAASGGYAAGRGAADGDAADRDLSGGGPSSFVGERGALTFVLDGLSKRMGLPQMKLGWIAASGPDPELEEATGRLEIIADAYLSAGAPIQNALPGLLASSEPFLERTRLRLTRNLGTLRSLLEGPLSPHRLLRCEGGWTAIVESPRLLSEEELALGLLREEGLWTQPGYFFDMEREAFFTFGLILRPEELERGAQAYRAYFERLMKG